MVKTSHKINMGYKTFFIEKDDYNPRAKEKINVQNSQKKMNLGTNEIMRFCL